MPNWGLVAKSTSAHGDCDAPEKQGPDALGWSRGCFKSCKLILASVLEGIDFDFVP